MPTTALPHDEIESWATTPLPELTAQAALLRDIGHGNIVSFSRKVFIPLTRLCRDICRYCTFVRGPRGAASAYLSPDEVLAIARAGVDSGCQEALFTLGDKPELKYEAARRALARLGHRTTVDYLAAMSALVLRETGLLPHVNPGVMSATDITALRQVSVSQGMMLENVSPRLGQRGGPHHGSPDKDPALRLATIEAAGLLKVPFTTGILIGIGETRAERIESLLAIEALHRRHGHIQEIIIQNFRAKDDTGMARVPEPDADDMLWTVAMARIVFGPEMNIQAPPNLSPGLIGDLIAAGINDWGGVSPVTPDHVNPEAPWPAIERLRAETAAAGKCLTERLAIYPEYVREAPRWLDPSVQTAVLRAADADGFARGEEWAPGRATRLRDHGLSHPIFSAPAIVTSRLDRIVQRAGAGNRLDEGDIVALFQARGAEFDAVCVAANALRQTVSGDTVGYVVNRNINYTNICNYGCRFCAFSKGKLGDTLRGPAYDLDGEEIARRVREAWDRGATEVCMQGGIHPRYTGATYLSILDAAKRSASDIHIHAFSPLEVHHGATSLGLGIGNYLDRLRGAGLGSLPGTAAEILDDEVRAVLCPDKLSTARWLAIVETAHRRGLRTTATIMFGHVDRPEHWARHLLHIRDLQERIGGFTEFVPLPFVHMEAPLYLKGRARKGPTFRETVLMHAVSRLVLHPLIPNIQVSWVKLGPDGAAACLNAGANDLGGTLMNESISRAAGTEHGQEFSPEQMDALIVSLGRAPRQRTTLYKDAPNERRAASYQAAELAPLVTQRAGRARGRCGLTAMQPQPRSKIAVLGGTGKEGSGLALRWANAGHHIVIGSRMRERAQEAAAAINARIGMDRAEGAGNLAAAQRGDIVVLTVPYAAQLATLEEVRTALAGKILIDVTVPLVPPQVGRVQLPDGGSAVVKAQAMLGPGVRVVSAFQNISAELLGELGQDVDCDVLVCGDDRDARAQVVALAQDAGMRAFHAGPLANSVVAEALTSVLITINRQHKVKHSGIAITGLPVEGPDA